MHRNLPAGEEERVLFSAEGKEWSRPGGVFGDVKGIVVAGDRGREGVFSSHPLELICIGSQEPTVRFSGALRAGS